MALRSLRQGFQHQARQARHKRAVRRFVSEARRKARLRERERWLEYQWARHMQRMADRKRRIDAAHRRRVGRHKAMLARRHAKLEAKRRVQMGPPGPIS